MPRPVTLADKKSAKTAAAKPAAPVPVKATVTKPPPEINNGVTNYDKGEQATNAEAGKQIATAAKGVALPAFLTQVETPALAPKETGTYFGYADPASAKWPLMVASGMSHGDMFVNVGGEYHKLDPCEYFILQGYSCRTEMVGKMGKIVYVSEDVADESNDKAQAHYICILAVRLGEKLIPCKGDFRGTKAGGVESAINAMDSAADPSWGKLSDAHRVTLSFPQPFGRVYSEMSTSYKIAKTSGNEMYVANCIARPATVSQMQLLIDHLQDDDFNADLKKVYAGYTNRVLQLQKIARDGPEPVPVNSAAARG